MARVVETITVNELLEALADATKGDTPAEARTCPELADEMGCGVDRIRRALRKVAQEGRLTIHRAHRINIIGQTVVVPAYTIAPKRKRRS